MANLKGITAGAALGTLVGSLFVFLYPKRLEIIEAVLDQTNGFADKAKEYADVMFTKGRKSSQRKMAYQNNYLRGGLAGLLLGAGAALFLTPKTGKQLRNHVTKSYNELFGRTQEVVSIFKNNAHPFQTRRPQQKRALPKRRQKTKTS